MLPVVVVRAVGGDVNVIVYVVEIIVADLADVRTVSDICPVTDVRTIADPAPDIRAVANPSVDIGAHPTLISPCKWVALAI